VPHLEILFEVDQRAEPVPAHHLPSWIRVALDGQPAVEHTYPDVEWHALAVGGLQHLLTASVAPGRYTVVVTFKGIDRNGKGYLKNKSFAFDLARAADHRVLRFRAAFNEEPQVTLEPLGESLLGARQAERPVDDLAYRLGVFAAEAGDYGTAASYFLAVLDRNPPIRRDDSRLRLAQAYAAVGLPEEAEAVLDTLITQTANDSMRARAWFLIEQLAFRDGRHARVLEAHERLGAGVSPDQTGEAHALAGLSALTLRAYPQALAAFRNVPKSSADTPLALYGQAQALSGLGDAFTASGTLTKLIQSRSIFDPIRSRVIERAHAALGFLFLQQGRDDEALTELGQVRSDNPVYETALFGVGWALRKQNEHVKAIAIFQDLLVRFPAGIHAHEARLALAASYADLRAYTRSVTAYRTALDALTTAMNTVDQRRAAIRESAWDPLVEVPPDEDSIAFTRASEHYRWLVRFEQDLRQTLDRFPAYLAGPPRSATLQNRLQTLDGSQLKANGQELLVKIEAVRNESRQALRALALDALVREQARLEDWSVQASLGIARNLVVERNEVGVEALTLE
jgi:tetratricopeptide (TPR) repeat protein